MTKVEGSQKLVRDTFQITKSQQERLKELARTTANSKSHYVREAIDHYLKSKEGLK